MIYTPVIYWAPPCWPGAHSLPPVFCQSYTGRNYNGYSFEDFRGIPHELCVTGGNLDAPHHIPAGSHLAPNITCNGRPVMERAHTIYHREIERGALS